MSETSLGNLTKILAIGSVGLPVSGILYNIKFTGFIKWNLRKNYIDITSTTFIILDVFFIYMHVTKMITS